MSATPHNPESGTTTIRQDILELRQTYIAMAEELSKAYLDQRKELQRRRIERTPRHVGTERKLARTYAPLLLCVREHKGVVEIYWATVHHGRYRPGMAPRKTIKRYLARGSRKDLSYSMRNLLKHARPWELDLVIGVEKRAAFLRRGLKVCSDLLQVIGKMRPKPNFDLMSCITSDGSAPAPAQSAEELPPGVMPTPTVLRDPSDGTEA